MRRCIRYLTGCVLGLQLLGSGGVSAQPTRADPAIPPDVVARSTASRPAQLTDSGTRDRADMISTTQDDQILLELRPGDTADPNPVDLEGRTLVFTPDGHGGYSRSVESLAWEDQLGEAVADAAMVELDSFTFDFADQRWGALYVSFVAHWPDRIVVTWLVRDT